MRGVLKMAKQSIKAESLKRLRTLVAAFGTDEELYASQQYQKNLMGFLNKYEKDNVETMVELIRKGYNNQTIIKTINERTRVEMAKSTKETTKKATDPVAEASEKIFIGYHVVEEPVKVEIGTETTESKDDKSETQAEESPVTKTAEVKKTEKKATKDSSEKPKKTTAKVEEKDVKQDDDNTPYIASLDPALKAKVMKTDESKDSTKNDVEKDTSEKTDDKGVSVVMSVVDITRKRMEALGIHV